MNFSRREWMRAASAAFLAAGNTEAAEPPLRVAGQDVEIQISPVSAHTVRLTVFPIQDGRLGTLSSDGSLVRTACGEPVARLHDTLPAQPVNCGDLRIEISREPLAFAFGTTKGGKIQQLKIDRETGVASFATGNAPLFGLGEGGRQFDRRGISDRMRS